MVCIGLITRILCNIKDGCIKDLRLPVYSTKSSVNSHLAIRSKPRLLSTLQSIFRALKNQSKLHKPQIAAATGRQRSVRGCYTPAESQLGCGESRSRTVFLCVYFQSVLSISKPKPFTLLCKLEVSNLYYSQLSLSSNLSVGLDSLGSHF